jgi:hypothetical protein
VIGLCGANRGRNSGLERCQAQVAHHACAAERGSDLPEADALAAAGGDCAALDADPLLAGNRAAGRPGQLLQQHEAALQQPGRHAGGRVEGLPPQGVPA